MLGLDFSERQLERAYLHSQEPASLRAVVGLRGTVGRGVQGGGDVARVNSARVCLARGAGGDPSGV